MVLTEGEKMILTPTYHVFEMYKVHQDAILLPTDLQCVDYIDDKSGEERMPAFGPGRGRGEEKTPALNVSASKDKSGKIHITICNLDPSKSVKLDCELRGAKVEKVSGRVLTASSITAHNTFDKPNVVKPDAFEDFKLNGSMLTAMLPAKSVVVLEVE
jgi:alpha-N-arabinofuranosidase